MNLPVEEENSNQEEEVPEEQPKEEPAFDEDEILLDDKTRPLNIEKDFEKLLEEDDEMPDNDVVEKIDEDLWKF